MTSRALVTCAALLQIGIAGNGAAQRLRVDWGAQAIPTLSETNIIPGSRSLGELRVVQPMGMLDVAALGDRIRLVATLDFEKYTIAHGELAPGDWGEGFEDRRRPHTLVHQLMLVAPDLSGRLLGPVQVFAGAGKGLVPFGTDDPMTRPAWRGPRRAKTSASLRWERGSWYGLVEWAHTRTAGGAFVFRSLLGEGALTLGRQRPYLRFEQSDRPEEERLFGSPFRTRRPLFENSILGITRWTIVTAGDAVTVWPNRRVRLAPYVEGSYLGIARVGGGVFDPQIQYGRTRGYEISAGVRLAAGMRMPRMGRYERESMQGMRMP